MANPKANDLVAAAADTPAIRTKRVIVHRPPENKDEGIRLGLNNHKVYAKFGVPVDVPAELVDYYRTQMTASISPDEKGLPVVSYSPFLTIQDVPASLAA